MECKNCKYLHKVNECFVDSVCDITHIISPVSCSITSDEEVETMDICYNCEHWLGWGDFGLSCRKNYYNCSNNGFDKACEQFKRKAVVQIEYDD